MNLTKNCNILVTALIKEVNLFDVNAISQRKELNF